MLVQGRRILIAGSASESCDPNLLAYAHNLVASVVQNLAAEGALFDVMVGKEPRISEAKGRLPQVFDWTIIETLCDMVKAGKLTAKPGAKLLATTVTSKTQAQIPEDRRSIWESLMTQDYIGILPGQHRWSSGAIRRSIIASHADILITLGGGEGVEHYASIFMSLSKPVIPLDLKIGSSSNDGSGGSLRILDRLMSNPRDFFPQTEPETLCASIDSISTRNGTKKTEDVATAILRLLHVIAPPSAFYVRLLDQKELDFYNVEHFFRNVVDPFVRSLDYQPVQMGRTPATRPMLDAQIFSGIHESTLVIADITGGRPNCLIELGYALALGRQLIVTAKKGTGPPFDIQSLDRFIWDPKVPETVTSSELTTHWTRVRARPPIVTPRGL